MDAWRIGVTIALTNELAPALTTLGMKMLGLKGDADKIGDSFSKWHLALKGAAGIVAGEALYSGFKRIADQGKDLLDQQSLLVRQNVDLNDVLRVQSDYYNNVAKAVPTSTASEYLKTVNELRAVTGDLNGAAGLAPKALKADALLGNVLGSDQSGAYYTLLRSAEIKGIATDAAKREQFTDEAIKYVTAFGGKLKPDDILQVAKRGGNAWHSIGIENLAPVMVGAADMGGSAEGTALMSLRQFQMGSTTLSRQQGDILSQLGLLDMTKAHKTGMGGSRLQLDPGAMTGSLQYSDNLPGWIKDVVYPAIAKASHGDEALLENILGKFSPNRNVTKQLQMFGDEGYLDQVKKDLGLKNQVMGIDQAYDEFTKNDPKGVDKAFNEQYKSMMEAIGGPFAQAAIPVMKQLTSLFTDIGSFANAHPEALKLVGEALIGLSAGLVVIGGAAVVLAAASFLPGGVVAAGVIALASVVTTLAALNVDGVVKVLQGIVDAVGNFINKMGGLLQQLLGLIGLGSGTGAIPRPKDAAPAPEWSAPGPGGRGVHPASWAPPANSNQPTTLHTAINIDGRRLATAVSQHMAANSSWSNSTSSFDGRAMASPTDVSYI